MQGLGVDRTARDRAAELVVLYRAGAVTNRDLEREWPECRHDNGVLAVEHYVWTLYSDFKCHYILDVDKENIETQKTLENIIAFLRSEEHYIYPHFATVDVDDYPRWMVVASLGLLGICNRRADEKLQRFLREMLAAGDISVWPSAGARGR